MKEKSKVSRLALRILGSILVIVALAALGGLFLPQSSTVSNTSLQVEAPVQAMFDLFNSHDGHRDMWVNAASRSGIEPMSFAEMGGPESGVGTRFCFCPGDSSGNSATGIISSLASGYGEITEVTEPGRVVIEIDWGFMRGRRIISLQEMDSAMVEVNWQEEFIIANPLFRYIPYFVSEIDFSPAITSAQWVVSNQ